MQVIEQDEIEMQRHVDTHAIDADYRLVVNDIPSRVISSVRNVEKEKDHQINL